MRIGIDLGTTNSLAAVLVDGRALVIPNERGECLTPSAVSIADDGTVLVGAAAKAREVTAPDRTACNFKRDMGTDRVFKLGGKSMRPESLSALVLAELKQVAERHLGLPVLEAVVTVPAYFGEEQRRATQMACELAGLHVERIINEPTAAALAYGFGQPDEEKRLAVLDLGGGTFDVSLLEVADGVIEIHASAGDARLGGEDFVEVMMDRARHHFRENDGVDFAPDSPYAPRLRAACERAKRALTQSERVSIIVTGESADKPSHVLEVERAQVHQWWEPLLSRLQNPIRRGLKDAGWMRSAIDHVLLVGGATRMPAISDLVVGLLNKEGMRTLPPDEAVAMGAAIQIALKVDDAQVEDLVVTDIAPFSLGVDRSERYGRRAVHDLFSPILERGTVLPTSRSEQFVTMADNQTSVHLGIYQGEQALCSDNTKLGEVRVNGIPRGPAESQGIEVRFSYDLNGVLEVEVTILETGEKKIVVLDRSGRGMSRSQLREAQKAMQGLKLHPRDALPNTTALEQAKAVFATLTRDERKLLGELIASFQACLESQDIDQIQNQRERLVGVVHSLARH